MDLHPDDDQNAFRQATIDWLEAYMPLDQARDRPAHLWADMASMGWLGMTTPDMGLDYATEALVFAELGRFLAPVGALSTAVAARWFEATGKVALALVSGEGLRVLDADSAKAALLAQAERTTLHALPPTLATIVSLDASVRQAIVPVDAGSRGLDSAQPALHLALLAAAYAVGCADAARDMAADYAAIREQFGKPIGSFQGVKHPCADMAVRCAVARSQLYYAACALDAGSADAAFHVAAAKRLADGAALDNARANIQVHGGIGMTDAASPHLLLKRAHLLQFVLPTRDADLLGQEA